MMNARVEACKETDIDLPDLIKNDHNTDLDKNSDNEANVEINWMTHKKTTSQSETIKAIPVAPGSKKNMTVQ
eukprot:5643643-Ditylum_brightwellii.AAC.1